MVLQYCYILDQMSLVSASTMFGRILPVLHGLQFTSVGFWNVIVSTRFILLPHESLCAHGMVYGSGMADDRTAYDTISHAASLYNRELFYRMVIPSLSGPPPRLRPRIALPRRLDNTPQKWDLSKLAPQFRRALAPNKSRASSRSGKVRGGTGGSGSATLVFDMSKEHFHHWTCADVLDGVASQVVTLSTVVYPLPLLARNPAYSSHPIFQAAATATAAAAYAGGGGAGQQAETLPRPGGAGQRGIEALETLLTRSVLRPKRELRDRAMELAGRVREKAEEWGQGRGRGRGGIDTLAAGRVPPPVRVVGIHARTYFVKAVSTDTVRRRRRRTRGGGGVAPPPCVSVHVHGRGGPDRRKA